MTKVTTVTFGSIEEVKDFLATNTDIPAKDKEAILANIMEAISDDEDTEPCDCNECTLSAIIEQLEELQTKADKLKVDVEAGKIDSFDGLKIALEYAIKSQELHSQGKKIKELLDAEEQEETEEEDNSEYLASVVFQTLDFLKQQGVEPTGNAYKGMVSATAMTIAALDDLGFIIQK